MGKINFILNTEQIYTKYTQQPPLLDKTVLFTNSSQGWRTKPCNRFMKRHSPRKERRLSLKDIHKEALVICAIF